MASDTATKLDELLDALAEYAGENKDKAREAALKLMDKESTKSIADVLLKKGRTQRTADAASKATEMEVENKALKDELAEAKAQLQEIQAKEPNWNRRLEENDRKWQAKLDAATSQVSEERNLSLRDKVEIERGTFKSALRIGQPGGVDEDYGVLLPAQYNQNFVPDPETRTVKVRELGETDSYYDPAEGPPAEQLARDVLAKLPPKVRIMGEPEPGGGVTGGRPQDKAMAALVAAKRMDPLYGGGF